MTRKNQVNLALSTEEREKRENEHVQTKCAFPNLFTAAQEQLDL